MHIENEVEHDNWLKYVVHFVVFVDSIVLCYI